MMRKRDNPPRRLCDLIPNLLPSPSLVWNGSCIASEPMPHLSTGPAPPLPPDERPAAAPASRGKDPAPHPLKILLATHFFYPNIGGLETVARVLAEEFLTLGHAVRLVTTSAARPGESDAGMFPYPVHRAPGGGELLRLMRWCDVFFQNNISLRTLWPLALVRRPWVVSHQTWLTRVDGTVGWQDRLNDALKALVAG